MANHVRLTWIRQGALDLSQVVDYAGNPLMFRKSGDSVVITEAALKHPLLINYINAGWFATTPLNPTPTSVPTPIKTITAPVPIKPAVAPTPIQPIVPPFPGTLEERRIHEDPTVVPMVYDPVAIATMTEIAPEIKSESPVEVAPVAPPVDAVLATADAAVAPEVKPETPPAATEQRGERRRHRR